MGISANKSKFSLTVQPTSAKASDSVRLVVTTDEDVGVGSGLGAEGVETNTDIDSRGRFAELYSAGLNPLRAVLVANTEFIPVGTGDVDNYTSTININFGDSESLNVTNLARLMELHRQIRETSIATAKSLMTHKTNYDPYTTYSRIKSFLKLNIDNVVASTVSQTVENSISQMLTYSESAPAGIATPPGVKVTKVTRDVLGGDKGLGGKGKVEIAGKSASKKSINLGKQKAYSGKSSSSFSESSGEVYLIPLSTIIKNNKTSVFLKSLITHGIYELIVWDIIKYISGILRLKEQLRSKYSLSGIDTTRGAESIYDSHFNLEFKSSAANYLFYDQDPSRNNLGTNVTESNDISGKKILEDVIGVTVTGGLGVGANTADVDLIFNAMSSLASKCLLLDSTAKLIDQKTSAPTIVPPGSAFHKHEGDLAKALNTLAALDFRSLIHTEERVLALTQMSSDINSSNKVNKENITKVIDCFENSEMEKMDVYTELLAAIAFENVYELTRNVPSKQSNFATLNRAVTPGSTKELFEMAIGEELTPTATNSLGSFVKEYPRLNASSKDNLGILSNFVSQLREDTTGDSNSVYAPLESTDNLNTSVNYMPGPEHFLDNALQRGDFELNDMVDFITSYEDQATAFAKDVLNYTCTGTTSTTKMLGSFTASSCAQSWLRDIGYEFDRISDNFESSIPSMALTILNAKSTDDSIKTFKSSFLGQLESGILFALGISGTTIPTEKNVEGIMESLYAQVEASTEERVIKFLREDAEISSSKLQLDGRKWPRTSGVGSNKYNVVMTNADNYWLTDKDKHFAKVNSGKMLNNPDNGTEIGESGENIFKVSKKEGDVNLGNAFRLYENDGSIVARVLVTAAVIAAVGALLILSGGLYGGLIAVGVAESAAYAAVMASLVIGLPSATVVGGGVAAAVGSARNGIRTGAIEQEIKGIQFSKVPRAFTNFILNTNMGYIENPSVYQPLSGEQGKLGAEGFFSRYNMQFVEAGLLANMGDKLNFSYPFANPGKYGMFNLGIHHRAFVYYSWVSLMMRKCLTVRIKSTNPDGLNNARLDIKMYGSEIKGMAYGLIDASNGVNELLTHYSDKSSVWQEAYSKANRIGKKLMTATKVREELIRANATVLYMHARQLSNNRDSIKKYVKEGNGTDRSKLAISAMKDSQVYSSTLKLISPEGMRTMYSSYVNVMKTNKDNFYSYEDQKSLTSYKIMNKILTAKGYGLNKNQVNGENNPVERGNRVVLHVGITNSMVQTLRHEAYQATLDSTYLDATKIAINVFKKNQLNSYEVTYPKVFIFDMKKFIYDTDKDGNDSGHITNYKDSWSFENVYSDMEFTTYEKPPSGTEIDNDVSDDYSVKNFTGASINDRDLVINHLFDYAFKSYYNLCLGLNFDESTFPLLKDAINYNHIVAYGNISTGDLRKDFQALQDVAAKVYPAVNIDPLLSAEFFRVLKIIKSSTPYAGMSKLKRTMYPKMFDRVFSLLVNEKDFVIHPGSVNDDWNDIYQVESNNMAFSPTSKIQRPEIIDDFSANFTGLPHATSSAQTVVKKYKASCKPDYPEVYTYYVTVNLIK